MVTELRHRGIKIQKEWLSRKISVEEAEREHLASDSRLGPEPVPFGFSNDEWMRVKGRIEEGDELWEFRIQHLGQSLRTSGHLPRARTVYP